MPSAMWVDADACPIVIKDMLIRACERTGIFITFVANQPVKVPAGLPMKAVQVQIGRAHV